MIHDLKPYLDMKDSGVTWLGKVPSHWDECRARYLFREFDQRSTTGTETHLSMSQRLGLVTNSEMEGRGLVSASYVGAKLCEPGDLVLNRLKAHLGVFAIASHSGLVSPDYTVFRRVSSNILMRFFESVLKSSACRGELRIRSKGLVEGFWRLYTDDFYSIKLPLPPLAEQSSIVCFLAHADRRIRRYIGAKKKLIALLDEQKQAIIHRAVTRGIDPNVRFKPSGVEWLGDVPEHWELRRLKQLFLEVDERSTSGTEVLLSLRMHRGLVPHAEVSNVPIGASALVGFKRVLSNQVVLNRMRASLGMVAVVPQPGLVSPDYAVFEPRKGVDQSYFVHLFKTRALGAIFRIESKGLGTGSSGFMRLYTDRFGAIKVPLPPITDQRSIVKSIAENTVTFDRTVGRLVREIALLSEYRTRLIADVVTGKLDVRQAAARLPDETDEPELMDDADALEDDNETDLDTALEEADA